MSTQFTGPSLSIVRILWYLQAALEGLIYAYEGPASPECGDALDQGLFRVGPSLVPRFVLGLSGSFLAVRSQWQGDFRDRRPCGILTLPLFPSFPVNPLLHMSVDFNAQQVGRRCMFAEQSGGFLTCSHSLCGPPPPLSLFSQVSLIRS